MNKIQLRDKIEKNVISLGRKHINTRRDKSIGYWYWRLFLEFIELGLSLIGLHKHNPLWEMTQISTIVIYLIDYYAEVKDDQDVYVIDNEIPLWIAEHGLVHEWCWLQDLFCKER